MKDIEVYKVKYICIYTTYIHTQYTILLQQRVRQELGKTPPGPPKHARLLPVRFMLTIDVSSLFFTAIHLGLWAFFMWQCEHQPN